MRIEISVSGPTGVRDVAVEAPDGSRVGDVAHLLARAAGGTTHSPLSLIAAPTETTVDMTAPLASLPTGAIVTPDVPTTNDLPPTTRELRVVGGARAGDIVPLPRGGITIGRGPGNAITVEGYGVSRDHASLEVSATATTLHDHGSTNGTWVDGERVHAPTRLRNGQVVRIGECLFEVAEVPPDVPRAGRGTAATPWVVHRAPRVPPDAADSVIDIPSAVEPSRPGRVQWLTATLPAVLGAGMALALDSPQFLLFALLSPLMVLSGALGDRVHWRRSKRRAGLLHREQLAAAQAKVARELDAETRRRRSASPDPTVVARIAAAAGPRLWERQRGDGDHLGVRVGSATRPADLRSRTGSTITAAGAVVDVPVTVDLRAGPIGIAGPPAEAGAIARWLLVQLAVFQSPADVEFVLLLAGSDESWHWARWLPQTSAVALGTAACTEMIETLSRTADRRRSPSAGGSESWSGRWTVVIADSAALACGGLSELLAAPSASGTSAICVSERDDRLPARCATLVSGHGAVGTTTLRSGACTGPITPDLVTPDWAERVARTLAPLTEAGPGSAALPTCCHLPDLLGAAAPDTAGVVRARWRDADHGARTVVGATLGATGAEPLVLDLVEDGPHALVVGTTGSGKSELLRTLVTGLAVGYPPDAITFLLVDYKGGAAFAGCAAFPHTAAVVTDLDSTLTRRALRSLHAELRRREGLLADAGVADIATYRRRHGPAAVPRLVIVVDEFAELAAELPEFVDGLLGVARRGRSLGVHLVLATQRPGGAVSADIRANTSLRIALRVTSVTDSTDVLGAPDAACLDPSQPGRAWARTAGGLVCFQAARATGSNYGPLTPTLEFLPRWRRTTAPGEPSTADAPEELVRVADVLTAAAIADGHAAVAPPWRPPLPEVLPLRHVPGRDGSAAAVIGLVDLPDQQSQPPLTIDLVNERSIVVAGRSGSGRTTALATVVLACADRAGPDGLETYIVDPAGDLAAAVGQLPHVATCLGPADGELVPRLLDRLVERTEQRARTRATTRMLVVLDGWDRILTGLDELTAGRCSEALHRLGRAGAGSATTVVITGDRDVLTPRLAGPGFDTKYLLALGERGDFGLAGIAARDVPDRLPPGRAVRASDAAVIQFAHPGDRHGHGAVRAAADSLAGRRTGRLPAAAIRLSRLPATVRLGDLASPPDAAVRLGVVGDGADLCAVDLVAHRPRLLVAGPPRSGRTTTLLSVLIEALRVGTDLLVAASERSPLHATATGRGIDVIAPDDERARTGGRLLLIDDAEDFADTPAGDWLTEWLDRTAAAAVLAGRSDELATAFRGPAARVRRDRCGILLRPGRLDGELLAVPAGTLATHGASRIGGPPGRGVIVGDPRWGPQFAAGVPVPIQVATP